MIKQIINNFAPKVCASENNFHRSRNLARLIAKQDKDDISIYFLSLRKAQCCCHTLQLSYVELSLGVKL